MVDRARIGIIGVGYIGEVHIASCQASGKAEVVAIADVNRDLLKSRQDAYGIPHTYTDYRAMLAAEELDGVIVATPDELHRAPVEAVAAAGRHLMLEKPIATSMQDAEAIVGAVERARIKCLLGFTLRFKTDYITVKKRFESGALGQPATAFMKRACTVDEARRLYGRCSVNQYLAVHDLDYLLWVFGADVESIYTVKSDFRVFDEWKTADHYWNIVKWRNGATASVLASWGMPKGHPMDVDTAALIIGTQGSAQISHDLRGEQTTFSTEQKVEIPEVFGGNAYVEECAHFADVVLGQAEPRATVYDGLNAYQLVAAGDESVRTGQPVQVKLVSHQ
jgi:predicted dehydrogenase